MLDYQKMSTAITADHHPVHEWFNFVAGYSPEYVEFVISQFRDRTGHNPKAILDPFAGCATTNVVANQLDIPSIGVERNPFFYQIGAAKANAATVCQHFETVDVEFRKRIENGCKTPVEGTLSKDAAKFLTKLFDESDLQTLLGLREYVLSLDGAVFQAGFVLLSKMLDYVTFAKTDGIYKAPTSVKHNESCENALRLSLEKLRDGMLLYSLYPSRTEFIYGSSVDREYAPGSVDLVVFSPPYLNNFDFAEMTRMQMYFWGQAESWKDISEKHRNHMLVNTTTALKTVRDHDAQMKMRSSLPEELLERIDPIVDELRRLRVVEKRSKEYYLIVYPYLSQMQSVLRGCYEATRDNGELHIVLSDAAFYGIHIDTQEYIATILESIGYSHVEIQQMRARGDRWKLEKRKSSGKQLGEYEIIAVKGDRS